MTKSIRTQKAELLLSLVEDFTNGHVTSVSHQVHALGGRGEFGGGYTEMEIKLIRPLRKSYEELESENMELRSKLAEVNAILNPVKCVEGDEDYE